MRVGMGLIKNEHGVWHVRKKVPKALEEATATVTGVSKPRVSWLKETLRTKDQKEAKVRAKPVMMKFDGILAQAEALLFERPLRTNLTEKEIQQIADYFYAHELVADQELREESVGSDPLFADIHRQLSEAGIEFNTSLACGDPSMAMSGFDRCGCSPGWTSPLPRISVDPRYDFLCPQNVIVILGAKLASHCIVFGRDSYKNNEHIDAHLNRQKAPVASEQKRSDNS